MHKFRTEARNLAWKDEKNPFAKRSWSYSRKNPLNDAENGETNGLVQVNTDPSRFHKRTDDSNGFDDSPTATTQSQSLPNAKSTRRANEAGDDIAFRNSTSPAASLKDVPISEKHAHDADHNKQPNNINYNDRLDSDTSDEPEKKGFAKFFSRKSKKSKKSDESGKEKKKFGVWPQIRATLFGSWVNILLIASPVGIAVSYAGNVNDIVVFVVNFIAIIPLAGLLSYATEEIALRTGEVLGGLLNASFGNAVELIVSIIALAHNQVLIVQTSLIGSILSNLLLVMGMCFFAGGVNRIEQAFNMTVAQTAASLLFLAVSSLIIPTAFEAWANTTSTDRTDSSAPPVIGVVKLSRATAILLLLVYACYLFFQLKSHAEMYNAPSEKNKKRDMSKQKRRLMTLVPGKGSKRGSKDYDDSPVGSSTAVGADPHASSAAVEVNLDGTNREQEEEEDEKEEPQLSIWVAVFTLACCTALVAVNAECLVDSINDITCGGGISKNFVGLILLPIVGNAAEHATAVTVAIKDKMDLAIGVAVGSSMQIALLVLPFTVVLGWILGNEDMTLYFDGFQIAVVFVAVLLVNYLIQDGKSHWLEGVLLMVLYIIIAVAAWFYPTAPGLNDCPAS